MDETCLRREGATIRATGRVEPIQRFRLPHNQRLFLLGKKKNAQLQTNRLVRVVLSPSLIFSSCQNTQLQEQGRRRGENRHHVHPSLLRPEADGPSRRTASWSSAERCKLDLKAVDLGRAQLLLPARARRQAADPRGAATSTSSSAEACSWRRQALLKARGASVHPEGSSSLTDCSSHALQQDTVSEAIRDSTIGFKKTEIGEFIYSSS